MSIFEILSQLLDGLGITSDENQKLLADFTDKNRIETLLETEQCKLFVSQLKNGLFIGSWLGDFAVCEEVLAFYRMEVSV